MSPLSGSRDATANTQISFLGVGARSLSQISVRGSRSGSHVGRLHPYSEGDGASFVPARPFAEGERVVVRAVVRQGRHRRALLDRFAVAERDSLTRTPEKIYQGSPAYVQGFRSRPTLRPPIVKVTASSPAVARGYEFVAPYTGPGQAGPMILDRSGGLIWFKPLPTNTFATDLRVQQYFGHPVLSWWQGDISVHGFGLGEDVIANAAYEDIARVRAGNGLRADLHDFQLTPRGTAFLTAYEPIRCDLSAVGGPANGAVTDGVLQEIDVRTGLVMYEWHSLDHVSLGESYRSIRETSAAEPFDYFHINSIDVNPDGSLLVSARNTWTAYLLDPRSGQIVWRLGGKRSSFKLGSGVATAWQHDPRELPNGSISIFDNGAVPNVHGQSRGIVVSLDPTHRSATLVQQVLHTPPLVSDSQGNFQALENGDWFVGWGQAPYFSELDPSGHLLFDAHFPAHTQSYRAYRFPWVGEPAHPPAFVFAPGGEETGTVYVSWNGATQVSSWQVLSGSTSRAMTVVARASRAGFETAIPVPAGDAGAYMAVQALDSSGAVLGTTATAKL